MQTDDNLTVERRSYLKGASSAILMGLMTGIVKTNPTGESLSLVKIGFKLEENIDGGHHIPLPDHNVYNDKLVLYNPSDSTMEKIENNNILSYAFEETPDERYQVLPAVLFQDKSRLDISTKLSGALTPINQISAIKPVAYPPVNIHVDNDAVIARSGDRKVTLSPGSQERINLDPKIVTIPPNGPNKTPREVTVNPIIIARQTPELQVEIFEEFEE